MRRTLGSLLAVLMLLTVGAGTVTATGRSDKSLDVCTNAAKDFYGGIEVYAKDKGKGANRVMCPHTREFVVCDPPACDPSLVARVGYRRDNDLDKRNHRRPWLGDIWRGFDRNIESFTLRAAAGCVTDVALYARSRFLPVSGISSQPDMATTPADTPSTARLDNTDGTEPTTRFYEIRRRKDNKATRVQVLVECPSDPVPE